MLYVRTQQLCLSGVKIQLFPKLIRSRITLGAKIEKNLFLEMNV